MGGTVGTHFESSIRCRSRRRRWGRCTGRGYAGRDVVVKVLRPGAEAMVRRDLDISFRMLFVLNLLFPNHHMRALSAIVSEFAKRIGDELDFRDEARNAETLRRNFAAEPRVVVPEVITAFTRRRVLVLEYVEGTRVDRLHERLASGELQLDTLMGTLVEVYLKMMLEDGFVHADPHPGNLLIDAAGRLVLLDFGMVVRVEQELRTRLIQTVLAVARQGLPAARVGGTGRALADGVLDGLAARGAGQVKVVVGAANQGANRFYAEGRLPAGRSALRPPGNPEQRLDPVMPFFIAIALALVLTWAARRLGLATGLVDRPPPAGAGADGLKIHTVPIPVLGGLGRDDGHPGHPAAARRGPAAGGGRRAWSWPPPSAWPTTPGRSGPGSGWPA